jgi:hypothetical protein
MGELGELAGGDGSKGMQASRCRRRHAVAAQYMASRAWQAQRAEQCL